MIVIVQINPLDSAEVVLRATDMMIGAARGFEGFLASAQLQSRRPSSWRKVSPRLVTPDWAVLFCSGLCELMRPPSALPSNARNLLRDKSETNDQKSNAMYAAASVMACVHVILFRLPLLAVPHWTKKIRSLRWVQVRSTVVERQGALPEVRRSAEDPSYNPWRHCCAREHGEGLDLSGAGFWIEFAAPEWRTWAPAVHLAK